MTVAAIIPHVGAVLESLAALLVFLILLSSLDDLFLDLRYWVRRAAVALGKRAPPQHLSTKELRSRPEGSLVIMVPAWHESDVIADMLENALGTLEYEQHMLFVGTYPNDPATIAEVDRVASRTPRVKRVEMSHPGPTCKADCLNQVVAAIFEHERATGARFAGVILHDSEDLLHPLELKYYNAMLSRFDMIQLPVVALEREWHQMVAGTYMDEFAESHVKEMLVREELCGSIPSAGVGTCFSRKALLALWKATRGMPFRTDSLTEDYEIGMRLSELGMRCTFALHCFEPGEAANAASVSGVRSRASQILSVREFFPSEFQSAYRQKARWTLGIGLQAWHHVPLKGRSWPVIYMMLHDRKGVLTNLIPPVAYLLVLATLVLQTGAAAHLWQPYTPAVFEHGGGWQLLLYLNGGLLVSRSAQRAYFTGWVYGWRQGLFAIPRMFIGNLVNCMAAGRAWKMYLRHRITGKALAWDKTKHQFPVGFQPKASPQRAAQDALPAPAASMPNPVFLGGGAAAGRLNPSYPHHSRPAVPQRQEQHG